MVSSESGTITSRRCSTASLATSPSMSCTTARFVSYPLWTTVPTSDCSMKSSTTIRHTPTSEPCSNGSGRRSMLAIEAGLPSPHVDAHPAANRSRYASGRPSTRPLSNHCSIALPEGKEAAHSVMMLQSPGKTRLYARAGIEIYWIVNLVDRQIEVLHPPDRPLGLARIRPAGRRADRRERLAPPQWRLHRGAGRS